MSKKSLEPLSTHLLDILQQLQISKEDRSIFNDDAAEIQNTIMTGIKNRDPKFKNAFRGLSLTGSYLDNLKLYVPDEFDYHVKLELDLKLTVIKDTGNNGFVFLQSNYVGDHHPILTESGFVDRVLLQTWLRSNFAPVIEELKEIHCSSGHTYVLKYELQGYGCAHSISATDKRDAKRAISFDFVPAFEFPSAVFPHFGNAPQHLRYMGEHWFAVPQGKKPADSRTFMVCAPHWERRIMHNKHKLKNALRLMKALRDANNMSHLTSYMLKSVFLLVLAEKHENFWKRSIAFIFGKMLGRLLCHLNYKRLEFYLAPNLNHFDRLSKAEIKRFHSTVYELLQRVKALRSYAHPVAYEDAAALFKLGS